MPAHISLIFADGVDAVFLARLSRIEPKRPLLAQIYEHLLRTTDDRFDTQTEPDGMPWAPLSPATLGIAYRMKGRKTHKEGKGGLKVATAGFSRYQAGKQMLRESGLLRRSFAPRYTADSISISNSRVYAAAQQFGLGERTSVGAGGGKGRRFAALPARPFVGLSENDLSAVRSIIVDFVAERLGA